MGARQKLNQSYVQGAMVVAAIIGLATQSWSAFAVTALFAIGLSIYSGEIRLTRDQTRRRKPQRRR